MMIPTQFSTILAMLIFITGLAGGCEQPTEPPKEEEPYFAPGEYGGDPLPDTEHLYNMQLSPDGSKIALIRSRTPGSLFEPRDQLWIVNADGTDPQLVGYNIGTVDWSPDGEKLAVSFIIGFHNTYIITFDINNKDDVRIWTGLENKYLYEQTTGNPRWFADGQRLLVSVWGKAYKQSYERGVYIVDTSNQHVEGPLIEIGAGALLGNNEEYFISSKYVSQDDSLNGNYIRYDFFRDKWDWITNFSDDSLDVWVTRPLPNPKTEDLVYTRHLNNAWQLFLLNKYGKENQQLTKLGASTPRWRNDGKAIYFNRDIHKAPGARYVPHYYELATEEIQPLWPDLPDSVPQFPALDTQDPIDFRAIIQSNSLNND